MKPLDSLRSRPLGHHVIALAYLRALARRGGPARRGDASAIESIESTSCDDQHLADACNRPSGVAAQSLVHGRTRRTAERRRRPAKVNNRQLRLQGMEPIK